MVRSESTDRWQLTGFGLRVESDFALPGAGLGPRFDEICPEAPLLSLTRVMDREIPYAGDEPRQLRGLLAFEGRGFAMLQGADGQVLYQYGHEARFLLSADTSTLSVWAKSWDDPSWQRVLLDTVLWTISVARGFELLHASAIETPEGLLALASSTGGGKSTLAAEFLQRGARLFADDVVGLSLDVKGVQIAYPGPRLMNLPPGLAVEAIPHARVQHQFPDETWALIDGEAPAARPLDAIVLLDRYIGAPLRCEPACVSILTLLGQMQFVMDLHLSPRLRAKRESRRFLVASHLLDQVRVLRLSADLAVPPHVLADTLQAGLQSA